MNFFLDPTPDGVDLVVTGDWSSRARKALMSGRADGLVLNYVKGFREQDLQFLEGLPLRRLDLLARTIGDLEPVHSLGATLETLHVQSDPRALIELERLPLLRRLSASWSQIQGSLRFAPKLQRLFILSYTERDLVPLTVAPELVSVVMKDYPQVQSLDGVEDLPWLAELGIHLAKGLDDISALERARSPVLETLQLTHSRRISDITPIRACSGLSFLDLSEDGDIPSATPLAGLVGLKELYMYGSTKILDGNLTPIASLPNLRDLKLMNRRFYSPPVQEIKDAIAQRWGSGEGVGNLGGVDPWERR